MEVPFTKERIQPDFTRYPFDTVRFCAAISIFNNYFIGKTFVTVESLLLDLGRVEGS